jgi:hypothetical protein
MILMSDDLSSRLGGVDLGIEPGDKISLEIKVGAEVIRSSVVSMSLKTGSIKITFLSSPHIPLLLHGARDHVSCVIYDGVNSCSLEMTNVSIEWDDTEGKHYCTICSNLDSERSTS